MSSALLSDENLLSFDLIKEKYEKTDENEDIELGCAYFRQALNDAAFKFLVPAKSAPAMDHGTKKNAN